MMFTERHLADLLQRGLEERWRRAYCNQGRHEQRRRIGWVIKLSAEIERVEGRGVRFATIIARGVVGDVLDGDWAMARSFVEILDEGACAEPWRPFVELLQQCLGEKPGEPS